MKTNNFKHFLIAALVICGIAADLTSCEKDNYDEPEAGIEGVIIDSTTGLPLETAAGKGSMQMRIWESSWAQNDTTINVNPQDLNMRQDGTFANYKLFAGEYRIVPFQGAFYPLDEEEYKTVKLSNGKTTKVEFTVTPYLTLEWVREPYQDGDTIKCAVRFTRNAGNGPMPDIQNMQMLVSHTQYVPGADGQVTPNALQPGPGEDQINNDKEGQTIELKSLPIKYSNRYWIRVSAKCNDAYKKDNYTSIKTIDVTVNH